MDDPSGALIILHDLAQQAEHDADAAALLEMLPRLLQLAGEKQLAAMAEGFYSRYRSQAEGRPGVDGHHSRIPNPYVVGTPLPAGSPLFFGREDLFSFIAENLRSNLVLAGQRRTGKSSLLKQLPLTLGDAYVPVYLDGQSITLEPGLPALFFNIATEISYALEDRGFYFEAPDLGDFAEQPTHIFEHRFLRQVRTCTGGRHLVLALDEFEELELAAARGSINATVFTFLRHLMQHRDDLSIIFCGTRRMEELTTEHWNVLFNIALYRHVGFLAYADALRLIREPVSIYGMCYDEPAMNTILDITSGHPYFLQLLCHSLVNYRNRSQRSSMGVSDVMRAVEEVLTLSQAHLIYVWNESTFDERLVLAALSRFVLPGEWVSPEQVCRFLAERGATMNRHAVYSALHRLALRDILAEQVGSDENESGATVRWCLGLVGLWVKKMKSLSRLVEESQK